MTAPALATRPVQSLKALDPEKMQLTNAVLKLLSGEMAISAVDGSPNANAFVTGDRTAFAALSATGKCLLGIDYTVDHACDILDKVDQVLRHVEGRLNIQIDPVAIHPAAQTAFGSEGAVILQIKAQDVTLLLALEPGAEQRLSWTEIANAASATPASIPVPLSIAFEAAKLPVAEAASIEGGDMLLLPRRILAILESPVDLPFQSAVADLTAMMLQPHGAYHDGEDIGMTDDETTGTPANFQVPVTVRLPIQYVDAAALAALHNGGSLQLGPLVQGLPVELLVGGRRIGTGEIVEIGDSFAVLVNDQSGETLAMETTGSVDLRTAESTAE